MSESVDPILKLARFTPHLGRPDRDTLMFAAGRAAARPSRFWPAVAGLLGVSQAVTLWMLWPVVPEPSPAPVTPPVVAAPSMEEITPVSPVPGSILWYRDGDHRSVSPPVEGSVVASNNPPMRAGSHLWE